MKAKGFQNSATSVKTVHLHLQFPVYLKILIKGRWAGFEGQPDLVVFSEPQKDALMFKALCSIFKAGVGLENSATGRRT